MKIKTYSELINFETFEERLEYLSLGNIVGESTFGSKRYLNQTLYKTKEWLSLRDKIIIRDSGCDLGVYGRDIKGRMLIHHINPITIEDILNHNPDVYDPENLITISHMTHEAVHYGNLDLVLKEPIIRTKNDTCPWKQ